MDERVRPCSGHQGWSVTFLLRLLDEARTRADHLDVERRYAQADAAHWQLLYDEVGNLEPDAELSINPKKAFKDLLEIRQLVKETEEIEARNSKLRDEESKLLPQLLDKILKNPSEREALKRVLTPDPVNRRRTTGPDSPTRRAHRRYRT